MPCWRLLRHTCRVPQLAVQAWLAEQRVKCYDDGRTALHAYLPRCLVPLTPSVDQAGGLARLTLRGHASEVTKVRLMNRLLRC